MLQVWQTVGYVEYEPYCQGILARRMEDGFLHRAPIFGDIREFISGGWVASYQGMVDVIIAGFPCQPFSVAGKGRAETDERNQWPNTLECVRLVRPRFVYLENVPGLLAHEYIRQIYGDLVEVGYNARWDCISAAHCGANHKRLRWWLMAISQSNGSG